MLRQGIFSGELRSAPGGIDPNSLSRGKQAAHLVRSGSILSFVSCEERERLTELYIQSLEKNVEAGSHAPETKDGAWREAALETRAACVEAAERLTEHRREHGC